MPPEDSKAAGVPEDVAPVRKQIRAFLDTPMRACIIPEDLYEQRKHPDVRIARRATTTAALARVISEREVSKALRRTLKTQPERLHRLATQRFHEISGTVPTVEPGEEV